MNSLFSQTTKSAGSLLLLLLILSGCSKDGILVPNEAYSNFRDDTTTGIKLTIPRIQKSILKGTEIRLYLSVTDQNGHPFTQFNEYNFTIKQVCTNRTDTTLVGSFDLKNANAEGKYIASALTLDYSPSMYEVATSVTDMEQAAKTFARLKVPLDQLEIIKFSRYVVNLQPFTDNLDSALKAIDNPYPYTSDGTAFYDALKVGLDDSKRLIDSNSEFLPAILGLTDGENNVSHMGFQDIVTLANDVQIPVYTLGFSNVIADTMILLADKTGGRYFFAPTTQDLAGIYAIISSQLKNFFEVSWVYTDPSCDEITVIVETWYKCKSGTFSSRAIKTFSLL